MLYINKYVCVYIFNINKMHLLFKSHFSTTS